MAKVIKLKDNTYLYGTIIENGSNENGYYKKYSDGNLEVWGDVELGSVQISTQNAGAYISSAQTSIEYPYPFIDRPKYRVITPQGGSGGYQILQTNNGNKTATGSYYLQRNASATVNNVIVGFYAIGKWK